MNKTVTQTLYRGFFGIGAAIMLGAMAAHALKDRLPEENLQVFETAVKYQFYGCIGLVLLALVHQQGWRDMQWPVRLLRFGILIFSGSLYFLAIRPLIGISGWAWIGAVTPFGGMSMILAWAWAGLLFLRKSDAPQTN